MIPFMLSIIIQLLLYFFFSYLIGHTFTPTQGVFMVSVILSDFFALFFHMIISLSWLFFGNKYLFKSIHMGRRYLMTVFMIIALSSGFAFLFSYLLECSFFSLLISDGLVINVPPNLDVYQPVNTQPLLVAVGRGPIWFPAVIFLLGSDGVPPFPS